MKYSAQIPERQEHFCTFALVGCHWFAKGFGLFSGLCVLVDVNALSRTIDWLISYVVLHEIDDELTATVTLISNFNIPYLVRLPLRCHSSLATVVPFILSGNHDGIPPVEDPPASRLCLIRTTERNGKKNKASNGCSCRLVSGWIYAVTTYQKAAAGRFFLFPPLFLVFIEHGLRRAFAVGIMPTGCFYHGLHFIGQ